MIGHPYFLFTDSGIIPPPPPTPDQATPGFVVRGIPSLGRRWETDDERDQGSIPPASVVPADVRTEEYAAKSAKITAAIARLRDETVAAANEARAIREQIAATLRARERARLEKELLLKEQALTLARAQEAALLEELQVIDIAYISVVALGLMLQ